MGYFDTEAGAYVPGATVDGFEGKPAGSRPPQHSPLNDPALKQAAKQFFPQGGRREREAPLSRLGADGSLSKSERRDLQRATETYASLDPEHVQQLSSSMATMLDELDGTVGPAESVAEEGEERVAFVNEFADDVEARTEELVEDQQEFMAWAEEQAGGWRELSAWVAQQDDPGEALHELAETFVAERQNDADFTDFVEELLGEDGIEQLAELSDEDRTEALGHLADAYAKQAGPDDEDDYDEDD